MTDPALRPALWMLLSAFAFATMGALTFALGSQCDWLVIALVRALFMLVSTTLIAHASGVKLVVFRPRTLWVRSLAGSFSLVCNFFALTRLPVADVLTLTNAYPLWIVLLSAFFLRQLPTASEYLGVASGLLGVVLIQRPHLSGDNLAATVALVSSISTACAMLGLHRLKGVDARAVVAHFAGVASLVALLWLGLRWNMMAPTKISAPLVMMLLGVGISGTAGQFFLTKAYATGVPSRVAVVSLTQVVFGMAYDLIFWHRSFSPLSLIGSALVLAPTAWLTSRKAGPRIKAPVTAKADLEASTTPSAS